MSSKKFIISTIKKNDPAEPEFIYYCCPKSPIPTLSACIHKDETIWDEDPATAEIYHSMSAVASDFDSLSSLMPKVNFIIQERIVTYNSLDISQFRDIVTQNRLKRILKGIDSDDVEFLKQNKILDLTIIT